MFQLCFSSSYDVPNISIILEEGGRGELIDIEVLTCHQEWGRVYANNSKGFK